MSLCLTYRTDELDRRHPLLPWLAEIARTGRFERIDLERFERNETARLVAAITGTEPEPEALDRIQGRAEGNAFFVEELLMAGGGQIAVGNLPPTVRATLTARVAAAPEPAQYVLRVASVSGRRVDEDVLAGVAGMDRDELNGGLRAAIDAHLLVADVDQSSTGYAFRHALVQEAVYDELLPGERRSVHRAYAEELAVRTTATGASGAAGAAQWASGPSLGRRPRRREGRPGIAPRRRRRDRGVRVRGRRPPLRARPGAVGQRPRPGRDARPGPGRPVRPGCQRRGGRRRVPTDGRPAPRGDLDRRCDGSGPRRAPPRAARPTPGSSATRRPPSRATTRR